MMKSDELKELVIQNVAAHLNTRGIPAVVQGSNSLSIKGVNVTYFFTMHQRDRYAARNPGGWYVIVEWNRTSWSNGRRTTQCSIKSKHRQRKDGTFAYENIADNLVKIADDNIVADAQAAQEQAAQEKRNTNKGKIDEFRKQYPDLPSNVILKPSELEHMPFKLAFDFGTLTEFQVHAILAVLGEVGLLGKKDGDQ